MSTAIISQYLNDKIGLIRYSDIISPQNYPLQTILEYYDNLENAIPKFHNFTIFHWTALKGKILISKVNERKYYFNTLGVFHINRKPGKIVWRYPDFEELKYQFYDAIICGAKGIIFFSFNRLNADTYSIIKKIVSEFRKTKFEDAVINGKYCPEIIQSDNLKINNDVSDQYGKDLWDCDYALYYYNEIYYLIISNNSSFSFEVQLNFDDLKIMKIEQIVENEKVQKIRFQNNSFDLHLSKYEIALFKIYGN